MMRIASLLIAFICFGSALSAQSSKKVFGSDGQSYDLDSLVINLELYLPPLNVMIDSALANAPEIEYYLQRQLMFEHEMALNRYDWLKNIRGSFNYFAGNNAFIGEALFLSGYNYGVGVTLPLGELVTRNNRIRMAEAASRSEAAKKEEQERAIREAVQDAYARLFTLRELIAFATEAKETSQFIYEQARERFVRGELSLDELGQQTDLRTKWGVNYVNVRNEFYETYRQLQMLVGTPFSKFNLD